MPASQGPKEEHFTKKTWVQKDICEHTPWPFPDKYFDFSICSHTLEDIRDPLYVCSELIRVSKAGYIEVPSRFSESIRGIENHKFVGLSHHRWLIEIEKGHIHFAQKYHMIHGDFQLSLPPSYAKKLTPENSIERLFWVNEFGYSEKVIHGLDKIHQHLAEYVARHHEYPGFSYFFQNVDYRLRKWSKGLRRRLPW
jgi:hypothetical protein